MGAAPPATLGSPARQEARDKYGSGLGGTGCRQSLELVRVEKLRSCTKLERFTEGCIASRIRLVRVPIASMGVLKAAWGVRRLRHVGEGVERDAPRVRGKTALMLAARFGQRDCLEALLQAGADKACAGCRCCTWALRGGRGCGRLPA